MPDYRRFFVPGGTFFFTVVVHQRRRLFADPAAITLLGSVLRRCVMRWPMRVDAIVLLPNHFHTIWSLPPGDSEYPKRLGWAKKEFTKQWLKIGGHEAPVSESRKRERRKGIWQPRYWEHTIEDVDDFDAHFDYVHWNPVKHGYVKCARDWPHSSFHRWVRRGVYREDWGCFTGTEGKKVLDLFSPPRSFFDRDYVLVDFDFAMYPKPSFLRARFLIAHDSRIFVVRSMTYTEMVSGLSSLSSPKSKR